MICMHVLFEQEVSTLLRAAAAGFLLERSAFIIRLKLLVRRSSAMFRIVALLFRLEW